jgi:hypothetical protein
MRLFPVGSAVLLATATLALSASSANALSFTLNFDDTFNSTLNPPFVGTGNFSFDENLADGTYVLGDLTNVAFDIDFSGDLFDETHVATPLEEVLIIISKAGQQVNFSNLLPFGSGFFSGSIDFFNPANSDIIALSFEPPAFNGSLNAYAAAGFVNSFSGNYADPIPTPALLPGLLGMGLAALRRQKQQAAQGELPQVES